MLYCIDITVLLYSSHVNENSHYIYNNNNSANYPVAFTFKFAIRWFPLLGKAYPAHIYAAPYP